MKKEYNYHTRVMGCDFDMTFVAESVVQADRYFMQSVKIAQSYEQRFSRFDVSSELFYINKNKSVKVSQDFLDIYWIAYHLYKNTQAQFNPLVQVSRIGYDKSFENIDKNAISSTNKNDYNINLDDVVILPGRIILQDSQKLDFGGFLKGHIAQRIAQNINSDYGMIINIGGDMYVKGYNCDNKKFVIEVAHPDDESKNIALTLVNKSLCTSGTYKRKWKQDNKKKHHILDSDTKDSSQTDVMSASVIHEKGAVADSYATLAVTFGSQKAQKFFSDQQIEFVIICVNGDIITSDNIK